MSSETGSGTWRVLLSTRWIFGHLLALVLIVAFISFGFWQLDRLDQKRAENAVRLEREALPPLQLSGGSADTVLLADAGNAAGLDLRHAEATGTFLPDSELLLRSRSWNGQPGWHVLTPLELSDGQQLLIDRGWVPYDHDTVPVLPATPPEGQVTVSGVLRATQRPPSGIGASFAPRNPEGSEPLRATWYVDLERLSVLQLPELLPAAWLLLQEQSPAQPGELPRPGFIEELDEGPHLGYALQWFSFAAVGIIGYALLMRRVLRDAARAGAAQPS